MKDKIISSVKETTDYSQFKMLKENREITNKAIAKIRKSVARDGWRNYPIAVNEKMEIIEGQHTYMYAKENHLPLRYYIQEGATQKDCQILNSTKTSWNARDYIHSYAQSGDSSYKFLELLIDRYSSFPVSSITNLIFNGDHQMTEIKNGKIKISNERFNAAVKMLNYFEKFMPYLKIIGGRKSEFLNALAIVYKMPNIDKNRLFDVIKKNCYVITPTPNIEVALSEIERVYNRGLRSENRVYIVTEYKKSRGGRK